MITTKQVQAKVKILDELIDEYKSKTGESVRNYTKYEQELFLRLKNAILFFDKYIDLGVRSLKIFNNSNMGRPRKLTLEEKVKILLIQRLVCKSNREMCFLLMLFSSLTKINISYKTVERLYDDESVFLVLQNMHNIILAENKISSSDCCGDGTGYVLSVKEHYNSIISKIKNKKSTKKKKILFSFTLMDIKKRTYLAFGTSFKSEKDAFNKAKKMLDQLNISLKSVRLDRYYSGKKLVKEFSEKHKDIDCYLIPKKNVTVRGCPAGNNMLKEFMNNTQEYLGEYFKRNQSESGFSEDKKRFGWRIPQKIEKRVNTAYFGIFTWHNLFWLRN